MLRLVKTQSANLHVIREVIFVTGIYRHGFLGVGVVWFFFGDSRILCGGLFRLRIPLHEPREALPALRTENGIAKRWVSKRNIKKADTLDDIGLAVFQIHRIAYGIRERFSLLSRSRFGNFRNCFLRRVPAVLLHVLIRNMNEVAEIEVFQLIGNKLLQRAVLPGFQMLIVQIAFQPVIHKVDVHLNGNLIVGDGGVGDTDLRRVAEIRLRAVFAPAEVGDQSLCPFYKRLLRLSLQLQPVRLCLPFACKFLGHAVCVNIVAVGLVVPHGVQGTEAPVKAYHMETVCGGNGFCGRLTSRYLCVRLFIRVIAVDTQILPCLLVVDGCAVIRKAVAFHRAVHITLCGFFCFFQRLIVPLLIKAVFKVMIHYDLILCCHSVGIIINHFFRQPFRFLGERVIQLPHFDDLCIDAARPQMLFCAVACSKKVFAVCPQPV